MSMEGEKLKTIGMARSCTAKEFQAEEKFPLAEALRTQSTREAFEIPAPQRDR